MTEASADVARKRMEQTKDITGYPEICNKSQKTEFYRCKANFSQDKSRNARKLRDG
jgi:hypothetical protein